MAPGGRFLMTCEMVGPTDSTTVDHVASEFQRLHVVLKERLVSVCPIIHGSFPSVAMWHLSIELETCCIQSDVLECETLDGRPLTSYWEPPTNSNSSTVTLQQIGCHWR